MSVKEVLRMGEPSLLKVSEPVVDLAAPELATLIQDLFDTLDATNGVGLSAPQIGVPLQVVVFGFDKNPRYPDAPPVPLTVLINPVITPLSNEEALAWEGCLSVPGMRGEVPRFTRIRYQGLAPDGTTMDRVAEGFHARVVQHECDHLMGTLYPMRMRDMSRFGFTDVLFPEQQGADAR